MKDKIKKFIEKTGYSIVNKKFLYPPGIYQNKEFMKIYKKCKSHTMVSVEKSFALYKAVKYVSKNNIYGDFIECGVWRGGQSMLAAFTFLNMQDVDRSLWLYDTYSGMAKPSKIDKKTNNTTDATKIWKKGNKKGYNEWCYSSLEEVKSNMLSTKYPENKINFIKGKVEKTIPKNIPQKISILRLDTDFYESTYCELKYLFPLIEKGGVLIIDDYGIWEGSRKAVNQYIKENNIKILLNKVDSGAICVKT
jgi:O-methyltransferase